MAKHDSRKILVFDDDPTGTQALSGVRVILRPDPAAFRKFMAGKERAAFVLTNTRSIPREEAIRRVAALKTEIERAAERANESMPFILLRGDSTLRGHIFDEIGVFAGPDSVALFVPAFPECGRVTEGGIHFLETGGARVPVAETEFAKDAVFGYRSKTMADWVEERSGGAWKAKLVPLPSLRAVGSTAVKQALLEAPPKTVVVPDAVSRDDIAAICEGLMAAEREGKSVVVRSASTFAAVRTGLQPLLLESVPQVKGKPVLVVCGSHTALSTRQLQKLSARSPVEPAFLPMETLLKHGEQRAVDPLEEKLRRDLAHHRLAILATERVRRAKYGDLQTGARVMSALTSAVSRIAHLCDGVISKGGITSADIATIGLGADSAYVEGQLEAGVSLWTLRLPGGGRQIPYAVIPGNVGDEDTIANVAEKFGCPLA